MVFQIQCQAQSLIIMLPLISMITLAVDLQIIKPYTHIFFILFSFYFISVIIFVSEKSPEFNL